ncbi:MAG: hypothetical protein ABRQ38_08215 [Candidatus Eremiobacterota bacterium]
MKSSDNKEDINSMTEHRGAKNLLHKLEDGNISLDYSNLLISAMGHWLSISAFSMLEDLFEDGIIGPGKISDHIGDALELMFKEFKSSMKKQTYVIQGSEEIPSNQCMSLIENMKKKGCRFFENLIFSIFEEPLELTTEELVKRLSCGKNIRNLDVVTGDGHGHSIFNLEDLESINKYGLPKTEKEFLEDEVLSKLKEKNIIIEQEEEINTHLCDISIGQYLDNGGKLFIKGKEGVTYELRNRDHLWEIEPELMAKNRDEFLGMPNYTNLVMKND